MNILRTQERITHVTDIDEIHRAIRLLRAPPRPRKLKPMGKLQEVAQRIAATQKKLNDDADKLLAQLNEVDAAAPAAFDRGRGILAQHKADIDAMESELRQLSNLPLPS